MRSTIVACVACLFLAGGMLDPGAASAADPVSAGFEVLPPGEMIEGRTDFEWMHQWWRWFSETPALSNPNQVSSATCEPQPESPVYMLSNVFFPSGRTERTVECTVPSGVPLLVPLFGAIRWGGVCSWAAGDLATWWSRQTFLITVEINGEPVDDVLSHAGQGEECSTFALPQGNLWGLPAGPMTDVKSQNVALLVRLEEGSHSVRTEIIWGSVDFIHHYEIEVARAESDAEFRRGDGNGDGEVDISDAVSTLLWLFLGADEPTCLDALDADDSAKQPSEGESESGIDVSDPIYLLNHLFLGGPAPPAPYPRCGGDPTDDELGCRAYGSCE